MNCSKSDYKPQNPSTALKISVSDDLGNKQPGTTVALYATQDDMKIDNNRIATKTTDTNGDVTFSELKTIKYYWFAQKGCKNNVFGSATTTNTLTGNITNTVSTVLEGTGELKFFNSSTNPYKIYINGQLYTEMNGGTQKTVDFAKTGNYTIRVVQVRGYVITPTDKTYIGNLVCGGTLITNFP